MKISNADLNILIDFVERATTGEFNKLGMKLIRKHPKIAISLLKDGVKEEVEKTKHYVVNSEKTKHYVVDSRDNRYFLDTDQVKCILGYRKDIYGKIEAIKYLRNDMVEKHTQLKTLGTPITLASAKSAVEEIFNSVVNNECVPIKTNT